MKGLWKSKYYGWIKDFKRKKNTKKHFFKDNFIHDSKRKVIGENIRKELDIYDLTIEVSYDDPNYVISNSIIHETIEPNFRKKILRMKGVFYNNNFCKINERNPNKIGFFIDATLKHVFYKITKNYSNIYIRVLKKEFLETRSFIVNDDSFQYYLHKKRIINNDKNPLIKSYKYLGFSKKYSKHRFNKFSRVEGKMISKNFDEDIKFKIPKNILSWIK